MLKIPSNRSILYYPFLLANYVAIKRLYKKRCNTSPSATRENVVVLGALPSVSATQNGRPLKCMNKPRFVCFSDASSIERNHRRVSAHPAHPIAAHRKSHCLRNIAYYIILNMLKWIHQLHDYIIRQRHYPSCATTIHHKIITLTSVSICLAASHSALCVASEPSSPCRLPSALPRIQPKYLKCHHWSLQV